MVRVKPKTKMAGAHKVGNILYVNFNNYRTNTKI
jgi:hypothetical protein